MRFSRIKNRISFFLLPAILLVFVYGVWRYLNSNEIKENDKGPVAINVEVV